jgi:hypothetical protein
MGSLVLAFVLSAEPTTAVVLARRTGATQADATAVTERVAQALAAQKVPGVLSLQETRARLARVAMTDATMCNGKSACHAELGKLLEVDFLVLVSVSQIAGEQSLAIELARAPTGDVLESESLLLAQRGQVPMEVLQRFAEVMTARVRSAAASPSPGDAPTQTTLVPAVKAPGPVEVPKPPPEKPRAVSLVLGGAGALALGAGVALLALGLTNRAEATASMDRGDGVRVSELRGSAALAKNDAATVQFALAGASAALGAGLGAAAIATW